MYSKPYITAVLLLAVTFLLGCSKAPKDFPPVYPCKITLTKDGNPVKAAITLTNSTYGGLAMGGNTEADGVAEISSRIGSYVAKGAPAGEFQVTVIEIPTLPHGIEKTPKEIEGMDGPALMAYSAAVDEARKAAVRVVPMSMTNPTTTLLKVTVAESKQGTEVSFEINDYK